MTFGQDVNRLKSENAGQHPSGTWVLGHWYALVSRFFRVPVVLTPSQAVQVEYYQLQDLLRRSAYWIGFLLIACVAVWIFGSKKSFVWVAVWTTGLVAAVSLYPVFLWKMVQTPNTAPQAQVRTLHRLSTIWLTVVALVWISGNWTLATQHDPYTPHFVLGQQTFVFLSILVCQLVTIITLSSSASALFGVTIVGVLFPFYAVIFGQLLEGNEKLSTTTLHIYFGGQLLAYFIAGLVTCRMQRNIYARQIVLTAERARANKFIVSVGHDLKQPLTAISLRLRTLSQKTENPEFKKIVAELKEQTIGLEEMIKGSFDLSRLDSGTWDIHAREVALPDFVARRVHDFAVLAAEKGLLFEVDTAPPFLIRTDPDALDRIIRNLVQNAVKYTPVQAADGAGKVRLAFEQMPNGLKISVTDNGIGIPADKLDQIFEEYVQLDNPERDRSKGFGLGLSIVSGLAKLLNHDLKVNSALGQGSSFSILVPIAARIPPELLQAPASPLLDKLKNMLVVVVEDNDSVRDAMADRLMDWGCDVVAGSSAEEVIRSLRDDRMGRKLDFVLSDYRLKEGKTGIDAIALIRNELGLQVPAGIWTAESAPEILREVSNGSVELIIKPGTDEEFVKVLARYALKEGPVDQKPGLEHELAG